MKLEIQLLPLATIIIILISFIALDSANCSKLSTVFILETDSSKQDLNSSVENRNFDDNKDRVKSNNKQVNNEDPTTRIITDDENEQPPSKTKPAASVNLHEGEFLISAENEQLTEPNRQKQADPEFSPPSPPLSLHQKQTPDIEDNSNSSRTPIKRLKQPSITIAFQNQGGKDGSSSLSGSHSITVTQTENGPSIVISTGESDLHQGGTAKHQHSEREQHQREQLQQGHKDLLIESDMKQPSGQHESQATSSTYRPSLLQSNDHDKPDTSYGHSEQLSEFPLNEKDCAFDLEAKNRRVVGGSDADPNKFLWMAAIIRSKPSSGEPLPFCGGSLITRRHVMTAAHCLLDLSPSDVLVRLGRYDFDDPNSSSLSDFAIDQFRRPANYSRRTNIADIAIMRLETPLALTDNYKTVCLPKRDDQFVGLLATVTGYGNQSRKRNETPKLRQVTVPIWDNKRCSMMYKENITDSLLCAGYEDGGEDACQGDSGGPLMAEGRDGRTMVVGVVSYGKGCGSPKHPGVYTRTTSYLDWIQKNTRQ